MDSYRTTSGKSLLMNVAVRVLIPPLSIMAFCLDCSITLMQYLITTSLNWEAKSAKNMFLSDTVVEGFVPDSAVCDRPLYRSCSQACTIEKEKIFEIWSSEYTPTLFSTVKKDCAGVPSSSSTTMELALFRPKTAL